MCTACGFITLWINKKQIFPASSMEIPPHKDMPGEIKNIYIEAAEISDKSPKSAAALLRLCLETLINNLKIPGSNLNDKIGNSQWPDKIKKACDSVRLYGNNAIHPGKIEITDEMNTVNILFTIINYLIEQEIHIPKIIDDIYEPFPESKKRKKNN